LFEFSITNELRPGKTCNVCFQTKCPSPMSLGTSAMNDAKGISHMTMHSFMQSEVMLRTS